MGRSQRGFASPFNARLLGSESGKFFSAFKDTDGVFGSQGASFKPIAETIPVPGALIPISPEDDATHREYHPQVRAEGCPPVLLIVPSSFQPDYEPEETVHLQAGHHCYTGLDGVLSLCRSTCRFIATVRWKASVPQNSRRIPS